MRMKWLCMALAAAVCLNLAGCAPGQKKAGKQVTLTIKTPPIGVGTVPGLGEKESYDLFVAAAE